MTTIFLKRLVLSVIACGTMVSSACKRDSSEIPTSQISASYSISVDGTGAFVNAELHGWLNGNGVDAERVELGDGDALRAESGDLSEPLIRQPRPLFDDMFDEATYAGELEVCEPGAPLDVVLDRSDGTFRSAVTLPGLSVMVAPIEGAVFSRRDGLTIEMDAPDDRYLVELRGTCVTGWEQSSERGSDRIDVVFDENDEGDCDVEVTVVREHHGLADPTFAFGSIVAARDSDPFTLRSTP